MRDLAALVAEITGAEIALVALLECGPQGSFALSTDGGATQTATHAIWCDTASGAIGMAVIIPLDDDLPISLNIRPQVEANGLTVNVA